MFAIASLLLQRNQSEITVQGSLPPGQAQALDPRGRTGHDHLCFPWGLALGDPISGTVLSVSSVLATAARQLWLLDSTATPTLTCKHL